MLTKSLNSDSPRINLAPWLLASGLGWIIGNWIANWCISSLISVIPSPVNPQSFVGLLISSISLALIRGILIGIFIGAFQWTIAKRFTELSWLWIVTNILGCSFAYISSSLAESAIFQVHSILLVAEGVPALASYAAIGLCGGISLGILQWPLAKNNICKPTAWLWISTISWSLPFIIYISFTYFAFIFPRNHGFVGLASTRNGFSINSLNLAGYLIYDGIGLIAGAITSLMLGLEYKRSANIDKGFH